MTTNAQVWLEKNCHRDIIRLDRLDISKNKLKGSLRFDGFNKLKELDCSNNDLTSLDVSNCKNLVSLTANNNRIDKIFLPRNDKGLEYLNLLNNNFPDQDLNCFNRLVNLKHLFIGNTDTDSEESLYNRFHGSLEPLKTLTNLESLSINNTDIDSGLEYLPDSVKIFRCSAKERKVKKICENLRIFAIEDNDVFAGRYNLKAWKENWILTTKLEKEKDQLEELTKKLCEYEDLNIQQTELEKKREDLLNKQEELKSKKNQLEQDIENFQQNVEVLNAKIKQTELIYQQKKLELDEKMEELNSFTEKQLMEKETLQKEANDLKEDLARKRKVKENLDKKLEKNTVELKNMEDEIANLLCQLSGVSSSMKDIKMEKEKLSNLKYKLNKKKYEEKSSTADLRKKMDNLKIQISLKTNELQKQLMESNQIKVKLDEVRKSVKTLEEEKTFLKKVLERYVENMQYSKDQLIDLETKLKEKEVLINELQQKNQQQIDYLEIKLNEKEILINKLQQNNEQQIDDLETQLNDKEILIQKLQQENQQQKIDLEIQLKENETLISKIQQEYKQQSIDINDIQQTNQQRLGEIHGLFYKIQTKENELNKLVNDIISKSELGRKGKDLLKKLLEDQNKFIRFNDSYYYEELEKTKKKISDDLIAEDIQNLPSLLKIQEEIIRLKLQFESITVI
ncbi:6341_t:CDS:1 [Funneliformis geosporum]|uniref:15709_t:CDS:1 n=1 Tax=Funneliformis geosporum TaxID=1117311 RepID=A0A9W4SSZ9_9GLOM|nr:15709_t:CDS:1 [Funneliformis geosporum]CAI2182759.1 6341_t:CDS:1 [Funneliformis geosporum]